MVVCDCTELEVSTNCIIRSIEEWLPSFFLVCKSCYEGEIIAAHECFNGSIQQDVWKVLSYRPICSDIYEQFVRTHTDCVQTLRTFLRQYKQILQNKEYTKSMYLILWYKDCIHGQVYCN